MNPDITEFDLRTKKRFKHVIMENYLPDAVHLMVQIDQSNKLHVMAIPKGEDINKYARGADAKTDKTGKK